MKEEIRFRISASKARCTLIKNLAETVAPLVGWEVGNYKPIQITPFNKNPEGSAAVYEIFIILFI